MFVTDPLECFPPFSHDVTAATLVFQNNETAAMLVCQKNPLGVELFSYVNAFFCPNTGSPSALFVGSGFKGHLVGIY